MTATDLEKRLMKLRKVARRASGVTPNQLSEITRLKEKIKKLEGIDIATTVNSFALASYLLDHIKSKLIVEPATQKQMNFLNDLLRKRKRQEIYQKLSKKVCSKMIDDLQGKKEKEFPKFTFADLTPQEQAVVKQLDIVDLTNED